MSSSNLQNSGFWSSDFFRDFEDLAQLRKTCSKLAENPDWVQGNGGNVSQKQGDTIWIKASGKKLASATSENIFVPLNFNAAKNALALRGNRSGEIDFQNFKYPNEEFAHLRPSIETSLHLVLPHRFVCHLHTLSAILAGSILGFGPEISKLSIFNTQIHSLPYLRPGIKLARAIEKLPLNDTASQIIFLRNHGLIIATSELPDIAKTLQMIDDFFGFSTFDGLHFQGSEHEIDGFTPITKYSFLAYSHRFTKSYSKPLFPDQLVYLGRIAIFDDIETARKAVSINKAIKCLIIKNTGVYSKNLLSPNANETCDLLLEILARLPPRRHLSQMPKSECEFIENWEAEAFRAKN